MWRCFGFRVWTDSSGFRAEVEKLRVEGVGCRFCRFGLGEGYFEFGVWAAGLKTALALMSRVEELRVYDLD